LHNSTMLLFRLCLNRDKKEGFLSLNIQNLMPLWQKWACSE